MKRFLMTAFFILLASIVAIASKIALPSEVNVNDFDSVFVKTLGFEVVASFYFIMIFTHNAIVTLVFGSRAKLSNTQIGVRFGLVFALIYLVGMQEVVIESSPFTAWGIDFVVYQLFGGAGEAVAALLLCTVIAKFSVEKKERYTRKSLTLRNKLSAVLLIALAFIIVRTICYETDIIHSNVRSFPIPCYIWTILFGIILGFCYTTLYSVFEKEKSQIKLSGKIVVLTMGLCWIIFNSFIGLIFTGEMLNLLLRSGLDVLTVFGVSLLLKNVHTPCGSK
jgi:hypothetical protein